METLILAHRQGAYVLQDGSIPPFEADSSGLSAAAIARGRQLAADDSYPPFEICQKIAAALTDDNLAAPGKQLARPSSKPRF